MSLIGKRQEAKLDIPASLQFNNLLCGSKHRIDLSPVNLGPAARFMLMFSNDERLQLDTKQLFGPEHWRDSAGALQCSAFSISQSSFSLGNSDKAHFEICFAPQVARRYESTLHVLTDSGQV